MSSPVMHSFKRQIHDVVPFPLIIKLNIDLKVPCLRIDANTPASRCKATSACSRERFAMGPPKEIKSAKGVPYIALVCRSSRFSPSDLVCRFEDVKCLKTFDGQTDSSEEKLA